MKAIGVSLWILASVVWTHADEWREFHGPQGNGVTAGKDPQQWGTQNGVEWKIDVPGVGWSTPF